MVSSDLYDADFLTRLTIKRLAELNKTRSKVRTGLAEMGWACRAVLAPPTPCEHRLNGTRRMHHALRLTHACFSGPPACALVAAAWHPDPGASPRACTRPPHPLGPRTRR